MGPGTIADLFAQRPVDLTEHQTLRWAAETAVAIEALTARRIIYGVMGPGIITRFRAAEPTRRRRAMTTRGFSMYIRT